MKILSRIGVVLTAVVAIIELLVLIKEK